MTNEQIEQVSRGGVVLFAGGRNPFKAGPGAVLSELIDIFTHSDLSHSAMAPALQAGELPYIYESTIDGGISGPQRSDLAARVAGYAKQGGHAWLYPFLPQFTPDWAALDAAALNMIAQREAGKLPYNVKRLFADAEGRSWLFDIVGLPADGIISYLAAHSKGIVCSEMVGLLCQAGGVPAKLVAAGIPWLPTIMPPGQPIGCSPQDIANVPMLAARIQLA